MTLNAAHFEHPWEAALVINALPDIGPVTVRRLCDAFGGDPRRYFACSDEELLRVKGFGPGMLQSLRNWEKHVDLGRECAQLEAMGARFVAQGDEAYPERLRTVYDPPVGLYRLGGALPAEGKPSVAIVGTRHASMYGLKVARGFARRLASMGVSIVSGMARGVDTAAHEGALEVGGATVAVLGNGLDIVFPPENLDLYKLIARMGCVYSEFRLGRRADKQTFPMRNRIVTGLSDAVLVVESDVRGGSMITARFASEQNRQVYVIPGRIDEERSRGCLQLIRDGAMLVTSVDEILEDLRFGHRVGTQAEFSLEADPVGSSPQAGELSPEEGLLWQCFGKERVWGHDALTAETGLAVQDVSVAVMKLELAGYLRKRVDGAWERP